MTTFPQYAKSTDPEVIATIERNQQHEREFLDRAVALSEKYTGGGGNAYISSRSHGAVLLGLRMTREQIETAPGQWKKPDGKGRSRPYRNNPIASEFDLAAEHEDVPGRPSLAWGSDYMGRGAIFVHDGAAWSGFDFMPDGSTKVDEGGWVEVKASEFHAAMEAVNAAAKETTR